MGVSFHSDFISHSRECLNDPENSKKVAKSLLKEGKVKIVEVPDFPNNTLTIQPSNKQFQKNLKEFAREHKNHKITKSEEKQLVAAFLEQVTQEQATYKAGGKNTGGLFIVEAVAHLRNPENADMILKALITKRRVKITDVAGFPNKTLTIRPSNKQFRKTLKNLDKERAKQPLNEKEKACLLKILFEELKQKKAEFKTQKTGKMKKYYMPSGINPERLKKKAEKGIIKELDPETVKAIAIQATTALDEINKRIELLEQKSSANTEDITASKQMVTKNQEAKIFTFETKTVNVFKGTRHKDQHLEREMAELTEQDQTKRTEDKQKQKESLELLKKDSILKTDEMRQIIRRESVKNKS